jgi:transcriptional regulator with XRE-family HTH domain
MKGDSVMSEIPSIGDVVRRWRTFHKLNVTEFAKRAGLTKGYVSELENNKIDNPTPPNLEKLAAAIGISVLELHARKMPPPARETEGVPQPTSTVTIQQNESDGDGIEGADFSFASPLKSSTRLSDKEQLRRILAHVNDLREMIEQLIREKGQDHG